MLPHESNRTTSSAITECTGSPNPTQVVNWLYCKMVCTNKTGDDMYNKTTFYEKEKCGDSCQAHDRDLYVTFAITFDGLIII